MVTIDGEKIDTDNKFMVGVQGDNIVFLMPIPPPDLNFPDLKI